MWVSDAAGRLHSYAAPSTWLASSLTLSGTGFTGFHPGDTQYSMLLPRTVQATTVSVGMVDSDAEVAITPVDTDTETPGHQVNLSIGDNDITATVTHGERSIAYRVSLHVIDAATLTDDATLSSLELTGVDFGTFRAAHRSYRATPVAHAVSSTTLTASAAAEGTVLTIKPGDADPDTEGHQINLRPGETNITVEVLSSDRTTKRKYSVVVPRASVSAFGWIPDKDVSVRSAPGATRGPVGLWSDGTTAWVSYEVNHTLRAFDLASGARAAASDITYVPSPSFVSGPGGAKPGSIWSNGELIWIVDNLHDRMYAYNLSTKARAADSDIIIRTRPPRGAGPRNNVAWGLWSDGETMWSADRWDKGIYPYSLETGRATPEEGFFINLPVRYQRDLWSDGVTLWIVEDPFSRTESLERVAAFNLETLKRVPSLDFKTLSHAGNHDPTGLWSDGSTMWVADQADWKLYAYNMPPRTYLSSLALSGLELTGFSSSTLSYRVSTSDDTSTTVTATAPDPRAVVSILPEDADSDDSNGHQVALGDGTTQITVTVTSGDETQTYEVAVVRPAVAVNGRFARDAYRDVNPGSSSAAVPAGALAGAWSDGTTTWSVDTDSDSLLATSVATGERVTGKDFTGLAAAGNADPRGLWSDGVTMWVSDGEDRRIYAYGITSKARVSSKEFDVSGVGWGNGPKGSVQGPLGIWSDGTTMWVVSDETDTAYAYVMATKERDSAKDLTLNGRSLQQPSSVTADSTTSGTGVSSRSVGRLPTPSNRWLNGGTNSLKATTSQLVTTRSTTAVAISAPGPNSAPRSLWTDGDVVWVSYADGRVLAFLRSTGERVRALDVRASSGWGVWADESSMYVVSPSESQIQVYKFPADYSEIVRSALNPPPLTAEFENVLWGYAVFDPSNAVHTFRLRFSEPLADDFSAASLRDHGIEVTNTRVISAERVDGRDDLWDITIALTNAEITVTLTSHSDCESDHAICTESGRPLSNSPSASIRFTGAPFTAEFEDVPESHNGADAFALKLRFSAATMFDATAMRDQTFTVTGGTITAAARDISERQLWTLTVAPDADSDVTVTLPAATDCAGTHSICSGLLPLSNSPSVTIVRTDDGESEDPEALTAAFESVPETFSGTTAFTLRLRFSESLRAGLSYKTLRDHAFTVTAGRVSKAKRVDGRNDLWDITVEPDGTGDVTVSLPATTDCAPAQALCASGNRPLTNSPSVTIVRTDDGESEDPEALTAAFESVPETFSGTPAFTLRLRFSESLRAGLSYKTLRDHAFTVTAGRVSKAKRVDGRNDLWDITVEPDGTGDVTVSLPATTDCAPAQALCASGNRPLTNSPSITIRR